MATGSCWLPSILKLTPSTIIAAGGTDKVTVAVNITVWPKVDGFTEDEMVVVVWKFIYVITLDNFCASGR